MNWTKIIRLFAALIYHVPFLHEFFTAFVVLFYPYFSKRDNKILSANLHRVLQLNTKTRMGKRMARQVIRSQVRAALDSLISLFYKPVKIDNIEGLKQFLRRDLDSPLLVLSAHVGAWELVAKYCADYSDRPFYVFAKKPRKRFFAVITQKIRETAGVKVLWNHKRASIVEAAEGLTRRDLSLGLVFDQKPKGRQGISCNFLGHPTSFVSGPVKFASRARARVVAVYLVRSDVGGYEFVFEELANPRDFPNDDILFDRMIASLEQIIKLYPDQWAWNYKTWEFKETL